jgi:NADPH:quinone reductase-like Zn-dependent oxidoreductase
MKCVRVPTHGSSDVLETTTVEEPQPGPSEVRIRIGETFPLEEAGAAHALIENRENRGKVVLHA